jgi:hypothetical protein
MSAPGLGRFTFFIDYANHVTMHARNRLDDRQPPPRFVAAVVDSGNKAKANLVRVGPLFTVVSALMSLANAATVDATINECSRGLDHPRVSQCVFDRATSARRDLDAAERAMRVRIEQSSEDVSYLKPIQQRFEVSVLLYQRYRDEQCGMYQALSSRSVYSEEIKRACEAMLDSDRTQQLKQGMWRLE